MKMNKQTFWQIIDRAREKADGFIFDINPAVGWLGMGKVLINELSMFGAADLFKWQRMLYFYRELLDKSKLWAAVHVINGKCSDSGFDFFRNWLIAQGKDVVLKTLRDPESLASLEICERGCNQFETLSYVAEEAYKARFGGDYKQFYADFEKSPRLREAIKKEIISEVVYADDIDIDLSKGDNLLNLLPRLCKKFKWTGRSNVYIASTGSVHDGTGNMSIQLPDNGRDISDYSGDEIMEILINDMRIENKIILKARKR